jgi:hypothetical protein
MYPLKPIFSASLFPFFLLQYKTLFLFLQTFATCFKSYSVYSNGYIHQWGIQSGVTESVQTRTPLLIPYTQDFTIVDACSARTPYYSSYTSDFTTLIFRIGGSGSEIIRWATFGY